MAAEISLKGKLNVYQALVAEFEQLIRVGAIGYGEKLPSCRALATERGINPNTVERAYSELEAEGYIRILPKKGAFVEYRENGRRAEPQTTQLLDIRLEELRKQLRELRAAGMTKAELEAVLEEVWKEAAENLPEAGYGWYRKSFGKPESEPEPAGAERDLPGGKENRGMREESGTKVGRKSPEKAEVEE